MSENIAGLHGLFLMLTPLPKDGLWWSLWLTSQTLSFFWGETNTYRCKHIRIHLKYVGAFPHDLVCLTTTHNKEFLKILVT